MLHDMDPCPNSWGRSPSGPIYAVIAELAARQHTMVARRQLLELGFNRKLIDLRLSRARLHPVFTGVYSVAPGRPTREGRWMPRSSPPARAPC